MVDAKEITISNFVSKTQTAMWLLIKSGGKRSLFS